MAKKKASTLELLTDEDLNPENVRVMISMRVPGDLLRAYKREAARLGISYQTLMQMKLREALGSQSLEKRVEALEKKLKRA